MSESDASMSLTDAETLKYAVERGAFQGAGRGLMSVGRRLVEVADELSEHHDGLLRLIAGVAEYWLRPTDWLEPYGPAISLGGRRSQVPSDLSERDVSRLAACAGELPHPLLRGRIHDVLFLSLSGAERINHARLHIEATLASDISAETWAHEIQSWERAIVVARRLKMPMEGLLRRLEQRMLNVVRAELAGFAALRASELLDRHHLGGSKSQLIAARLAEIGAESSEPARARGYREGAARWYRVSGDSIAADQQIVEIVHSLIDEAESIAMVADSGSSGRSAHLFELALQNVRRLSRAARAREGVAELPAWLARRIREAGVTQLGNMRMFSSESLSLTDIAMKAAEWVADRPAPEALAQFAALYPMVDFAKEMSGAKELIGSHPLTFMFSHVTYSHDGRVVYRDQGRGGTPIYGVDPAIWRQMIQSYTWRIGILVQGMIWPAYEQLTLDHRLNGTDFEAIVRGSAIVPLDRVSQFSRGLFLGYSAEFAAAAHLLVPQIENVVRFHLGNAGIMTTTIESGVEHEVGLSSLMEREGVDDVFGADLCFELRALLCGPLGPNLRNEIAHGLLNDAAASSVNTVYLWWFSLRLVFVPFWNSIHNAEAAEAREPAERRDDSGA